MKSVLFVCSYYPPDSGGVEQYVANIARRVAADHTAGVRVAVLCATHDDGHPLYAAPRIERDGAVTVVRVPTWRRLSNSALSARFLTIVRRVMAHCQPDVVNIHAPVPGLPDLAARAVGDVPMVWTYHTGPMRKPQWHLDQITRAYERFVLPGSARRARAVVASSAWCGQAMEHAIGHGAVVISPGFDPETFRPEPAAVQPGVFGFVASLNAASRYKGLADLIAAWPRVRAQCPSARLEVIGDGVDVAAYRTMAADHAVAEAITFRGRLEPGDVAAAMHRWQALILPTHFDSFPTVLVESMASGRPVITTPVGGIGELVRDGENGWLVPPGDVDALAGSVVEALGDPAECDRRGATGLRQVLQERTWEAVTARTLQVLHQAVSPH